jgi:hypothetical protein
MNEVSTTTIPDTAKAAQHCPSWCRADHEAGSTGHQTERRSVVRVPAASMNASSVHAFQVGEGSDLRVCIEGEFFTVDAAREYAAKIVETCRSVDTPDDGWPTNIWAIFRKAHGLSQREVAAAVGTSASRLGRIERDEVRLERGPLYWRLINLYAAAKEPEPVLA